MIDFLLIHLDLVFALTSSLIKQQMWTNMMNSKD